MVHLASSAACISANQDSPGLGPPGLGGGPVVAAISGPPYSPGGPVIGRTSLGVT